MICLLKSRRFGAKILAICIIWNTIIPYGESGLESIIDGDTLFENPELFYGRKTVQSSGFIFQVLMKTAGSKLGL